MAVTDLLATQQVVLSPLQPGFLKMLSIAVHFSCCPSSLSCFIPSPASLLSHSRLPILLISKAIGTFGRLCPVALPAWGRQTLELGKNDIALTWRSPDKKWILKVSECPALFRTCAASNWITELYFLIITSAQLGCFITFCFQAHCWLFHNKSI